MNTLSFCVVAWNSHRQVCTPNKPAFPRHLPHAASPTSLTLPHAVLLQRYAFKVSALQKLLVDATSFHAGRRNSTRTGIVGAYRPRNSMCTCNCHKQQLHEIMHLAHVSALSKDRGRDTWSRKQPSWLAHMPHMPHMQMFSSTAFTRM